MLEFKRPEGYSDDEWAAFQAGVRECMRAIGSLCFDLAGSGEPPADAEESAPDVDPADLDVGQDCPACGEGRIIGELGAAPYCPACETVFEDAPETERDMT